MGDLMDFSFIDSSLQYGKVPSKTEFALIWIFLILLLLIPLITICILIFSYCGLMNLDNQIVSALILVNVEFCVFLAIVIYLIYYFKKLYKNIKLWLKDCVETQAFVSRMDLVSMKYKPFQVEFSFSIDGKEYKRLSAYGGLIVGLNKRYIKYHNKTVKILYSPKYDQVLVLKNDKGIK